MGGGHTVGIRRPKQSLPSGLWQTTLAQGRHLRCFFFLHVVLTPILFIAFVLNLIPILWGLDSQNSHYPRDFDRRLWHRGGTLDVSARKLKIYVWIWRHVQGCFDTKLCHMGRELSHIFQNCLIPLGNPATLISAQECDILLTILIWYTNGLITSLNYTISPALTRHLSLCPIPAGQTPLVRKWCVTCCVQRK